MKKKINKLWIILSVVVIVLLGGTYLYLNNSKNIFIKILNKGYKNIEDTLDNIDVSYDKTTKLNSDLSFDFNVSDKYKDVIDQNILDEINKLQFFINATQDYKSKEFSFELNTKYDKNDLFDVAMYGQNKSFYVELKNLYDKYIEIPYEEYDSLFENSNMEINKIKYVLKTIKDNLFKNLNQKDFKKSKEKLNIQKNKIEVNKIEYEVTEEKTTKLLINTLKDLEKDKKFIKYISELGEVDEKEIASSINELIKELEAETEFENETFVSLSLYTKGLLNDYIGFEINFNNLGKLNIYNYNDVIYGNLYITGKKVAELTSKKQKENEYETIINVQNEEEKVNITINSKITEKLIDIDYSIVSSGITIDGKLTEKTTKKDSININNSKLNINIKDNDELIATFNINNNTNIEQTDEPFTNILSKERINYENITEKDMNSIYENIGKNETLVNFINRMTERFGEPEPIED